MPKNLAASLIPSYANACGLLIRAFYMPDMGLAKRSCIDKSKLNKYYSATCTMLFDSLSFAAFFPTVVFLYYLTPEKVRPYLLLLASCVFYMAFVPMYILILFGLITLDFFLAHAIERHRGKYRWIYLLVSIISNVGILFVFKYFNFFNANIGLLAHMLHWNYSLGFLSLALPLGLSFHVFQSLSYVIEVYRRNYPAEKNYLIYALYVMFFPQLVAGPIERPEHLLPQFRKTHAWNEARVIRGLERMLWGFFKKLVIADNLAPIVDHIYASGTLDGPALLIAIVGFSYQLYCDFSGYSDIAVGTAQVLGYEVMENFDRPYSSRSVGEFWRRWHISLSSWLRDYVYIPLGGNRVAPYRRYFNLIVTFLLSGLWHGANWTFVVMGALFGSYLVIGIITADWRKQLTEITGLSRMPRLHHAVQVCITFMLVSVAWIFFRAPTFTRAWEFITHVGTGLPQLVQLSYLRYNLFGFPVLGPSNKITLFFTIAAIVALEIVQYFQTKEQTRTPWERWSPTWLWTWRYGTLSAILLFGYFGSLTFIYFQF